MQEILTSAVLTKKRIMVVDCKICIASLQIPLQDDFLLKHMVEGCGRRGIEVLVWCGKVVNGSEYEKLADVTKFIGRRVAVQYWLGMQEGGDLPLHSLVLFPGLRQLYGSGRLRIVESGELEAGQGKWLIASGMGDCDSALDLAHRERKHVVVRSKRWFGVREGKYFVLGTGRMARGEYLSLECSQGYWYLIDGKPVIPD